MAKAGTGATYGVYGESQSDSGYGVFGYAAADSGITSGVFGMTSSEHCRGCMA
jgi:hypothetical protein